MSITTSFRMQIFETCLRYNCRFFLLFIVFFALFTNNCFYINRNPARRSSASRGTRSYIHTCKQVTKMSVFFLFFFFSVFCLPVLLLQKTWTENSPLGLFVEFQDLQLQYACNTKNELMVYIIFAPYSTNAFTCSMVNQSNSL